MFIKTKNVYVTRDSGCYSINIWPDEIGIRKFHGCVQYGAAWQENYCSKAFFKASYETGPSILYTNGFKQAFGFLPRSGQAWHINGKGKRTKVELAFSG